RYAGKAQALTFSERVPDVDRAVIVQADDVTCMSILRLSAVCRHEGQRIADAHLLVETYMEEAHATLVTPRAQAQESDAITMTRIHVRLDLEYESRERGFAGAHLAPVGLARSRRGRMRHEAA